jgi:membrane protease YdiL (CAAX protease family)
MSFLRSIATRASPRTEFLIVCVLAFGLMTFSSLRAVFSMLSAPPPAVAMARATFDTRALEWLMAYESAVLVVLGLFLAARGWTVRQLGLVPSWSETGFGIALAIAMFVVTTITMMAGMGVSTGLAILHQVVHPTVAHLSVGTIAAISVLNPLYEEMLVAGYLVSTLKKTRGFWVAVNTSTAVRMTYHLYQGPAAVLAILPVGFVFAYWYARTGRLWPLIVAHAFMDGAALLSYQ